MADLIYYHQEMVCNDYDEKFFIDIEVVSFCGLKIGSQ